MPARHHPFAAVGPRRFALLVCACGLLVTTATAVDAYAPDRSVPDRLVPTAPVAHDAGAGIVVRATRIAEPIRVDGRLDEAIYDTVAPLTEFFQTEPHEGEPATGKTEAWVFFDDRNVYVACRCWQDPDRILANEMRRDTQSISQHDHVAVGLDTFHDGRNGFQFGMSAAGGLRDGLITDEKNNFDWNGVYEARAGRFDGGWIAEFAIPFKTLRYLPRREQVWHIQIRRLIRSKNEMIYLTRLSASWAMTALNHFASGATLVGLEAPPPGLNFEAKVYGMSRVTTDLLAVPAVKNDTEPDAGVDVKYGITKSLTADFTYNTDFAQVEADEAQINLTRFNLVFPEKREFFLEGQGIFDFGAGSLSNVSAVAPTIFFSRRIGLSGGRSVPVIAGARLSGKAGPWSIGAFDMATDADRAAGAARTNFAVLRLRRNILRRSTVGGIFTSRSVSTLAPGANHVWGIDANLAFHRNVYISGYLAQSLTDMEPGDDRSYRIQFNYTADRYGLSIDRNVVEERFSPEIGFLRRANFRRNFAEARFSPRAAGSRVIRKWTYLASADYITDNDDTLESREIRGLVRIDFHNSDAVAFEATRQYESLADPFLVAPGIRIPVGGHGFGSALLSFTAGAQHRVSGTTSLEVGSFYGGEKKSLTYRGRIDVTPRLGVEPTMSLNWVDLPQGRFTSTIHGGRAVFTATPQMYVAALVQYNSSSTSLATNLRFRWEYRPGSELFVVYTEGRSTVSPAGIEALQNRGFVVKINRLFRF